jgi:predicted PurR-regulated permease PerM
VSDQPQRQRVEVVVSARTVLRVFALGTAFVALAYLLYAVRDVLILVLLSAFLAFALNPAVVLLERRVPMRRGPATLAVFLSVLVIIAAFATAILTPLYDEVERFVNDLPAFVDDIRESPLIRDLDQKYNILDSLQKQVDELPARLPDAGSLLLGVAGRVFTAVINALTVLFLTFFLLLELPNITRSLLDLLRPAAADRVARVQNEINVTLARYVVGVLLIATIAGIVTFVTLTLLSVPFALVLALVVAVFDLVPLIGATIGLVIVVLVAFTQGVTPGVAMLIIGVAYQQIENNVIQPVVQKRSVSVSPFVVLVTVLIGTSLLGVVGALLAIPAAGSIQIALREVLEERREIVKAHRHALELEAQARTRSEPGPVAP